MDDAHVSILWNVCHLIGIMMHQLAIYSDNDVWEGVIHHANDILYGHIGTPGQVSMFVNSDFLVTHSEL